MIKDKKSKGKKEETYEGMDKELLDELALAENEGFSMAQHLMNNRKKLRKRIAKIKSAKQID